MRAATRGEAWATSQGSGGRGRCTESGEEAVVQAVWREVCQASEPVAGQPSNMWSSSSMGALQQEQAGEGARWWRWRRSWVEREPARTRAIHLMTAGRVGWWKLEPLTAGRRKMKQDADQSNSTEGGYREPMRGRRVVQREEERAHQSREKASSTVRMGRSVESKS